MKHDRCHMFKVLGVGTRVKIIEILKSEGPLGAKRIAQMIGVTPAAVSQHLRVLKQAGLVNSERKGYFIPYQVDVRRLEDCCHDLIEVCKCEPHRPAGTPTRQRHELSLADLKERRKWLESELRVVTDKIEELSRRSKKD